MGICETPGNLRWMTQRKLSSAQTMAETLRRNQRAQGHGKRKEQHRTIILVIINNEEKDEVRKAYECAYIQQGGQGILGLERVCG